jgi:hypothetical protein
VARPLVSDSSSKSRTREEDDVAILAQEELDEVPTFKRICLQDNPYVLAEGIKHQAAWILTRQQILNLQERCQFLNQTSGSREYMSTFSLFGSGKYKHFGGSQWSCNVHKVIPAERFSSFFIHHYYPRGRSKTTSEAVEDLLRADAAVPDCWRRLIRKYYAAQTSFVREANETSAIDIYAGFNASSYDGKAIRAPSARQVYLVINGTKRGIPDPETFTRMNFTWSDVIWLSDYEMSLFPIDSRAS